MRSYSDGDLVEALKTSTSWRGVLRALKLTTTSAGSMRSVRAHADRLGLSYSHFRGQRRWSERELVDAVIASDSWAQVATALGLKGGSATTTLRGHAYRLALDTAHLTTQPRPRQVDQDLVPQRALLARAGPLVAASWFELCGIPVSWPLEPTRYDLLVWQRGRADRVQVKTSAHRRGSTWVVQLATTRKEVHTYGPEEIECFFIIDGDLNYYLIPLQVVCRLKSVSLSAYQDYLLPRL